MEKEFAEAQRRHEEGSLKIVPVIWNLADCKILHLVRLKHYLKTGKLLLCGIIKNSNDGCNSTLTKYIKH